MIGLAVLDTVSKPREQSEQTTSFDLRKTVMCSDGPSASLRGEFLPLRPCELRRRLAAVQKIEQRERAVNAFNVCGPRHPRRRR